MSPESDSNAEIGRETDPTEPVPPVEPVEQHRARIAPWKVATPLIGLVIGSMMTISALDSQGQDLRPGRYENLNSVVRGVADEVTRLQAHAAKLDREVQRLSAKLADETTDEANTKISAVKPDAGMTEVSGAAVQVALTDAPQEIIESSELNKNWLVVHQQDIQAVVNAMWRGGAQAITLQGQRIISTTGIKCTGNAVTLQGVPYAPPYVVVGIGDQAAIADAVMSDSYLRVYREQAADPKIGIGWSLDYQDFAKAPAYTDVVNLRYAKPA